MTLCMQVNNYFTAASNDYFLLIYLLADLTVSKRPGSSDRIEIHFPVFKSLYLLFSYMKLVET